jgi:hypothetical protein
VLAHAATAHWSAASLLPVNPPEIHSLLVQRPQDQVLKPVGVLLVDAAREGDGGVLVTRVG